MQALFRAAFLILLTALPAAGQTAVTFGGIKADPTRPVEVTADSLSVSQADGTAVFTGNVVIVQGDMRLAAAVVQVEYAKDDQKKIERLHATGGVTLAAGSDAAEAKEAVYTVSLSTIRMTGDVLLTQGQNVMSGQSLDIDLKSGVARMEGRVKTVLQPGGN